MIIKLKLHIGHSFWEILPIKVEIKMLFTALH